jgi:hypothetical protein
MSQNLSNVVVEWLAPLLRIQEVPGSNLCPETGCPDWGFSWISSVPPGWAALPIRLWPLSSISFIVQSRGSSGSIVSDYGLDDRVIKVRSLTGAEDFSSSPCVQTVSEAHPASYPMGTGGPVPGGKERSGRDADHSPPSSGRCQVWAGALPPLPPCAFMTCSGTPLLFH